METDSAKRQDRRRIKKLREELFLGCSIEEFESIRKTVNSPLPMADKDDSENDCSAMEDDDMNFDSDSLASENLTEDSADNSDQFSLSSNLAMCFVYVMDDHRLRYFFLPMHRNP